MNTFADILVWVCFIFGLGLFSYGFHGYYHDTIKPLIQQRRNDNER